MEKFQKSMVLFFYHLYKYMQEILIMKHSNKKVDYIICPHCGAEYLPSEIYYPDKFLGKPHDIDKVNSGKIDNFLGKSMDLEESYQCDFCDTKFRVTAKVQFKVEQVSKYDMSKAYVTPLFEEKLTLEEGIAE